MKTYYIGLATTFHDPALAIVNSEGEIVFAEATERYYQNKRAINVAPDNTEWARRLIAKYTEPDANFVVAGSWNSGMRRFLRMIDFTGIANPYKIHRHHQLAPMSFSTKHEGLWVCIMQLAAFNKAGAGIGLALAEHFKNRKVRFVNFQHHLTHAEAATHMSPFESGACMVVDNNGEKGSISYFDYKAGKLREIRQIRGAASLGSLYSAVTNYCGFEATKGEEWKVMGLAPYGKPIPAVYEAFQELMVVDGMNLKYTGKANFKKLMDRLEEARCPADGNTRDAADLACTMQTVYEETMTLLLRNFHSENPSENLILSGGCGLNSAYNGKIAEQTPFKNVYIPSSPGDDGNAVGAALLAYRQDHPNVAPRTKAHHPYLGSSLSSVSLDNLKTFGRFQKIRHIPETIHEETAALLAQGKLVGWAQGRAEFGPRALGNRSILADPRPASMKDTINMKVKFREEFRPFAPAILAEFGPEYFEAFQETPYMERTLRFRDEVKDKVPAVVHVNGTGRLQTVTREWNEPYYKLIKAFYELTGVPIVLNTSFNVMGKPIIHTVEDALGVFFTTGLDALVLEGYLIEK
jgi:carbamoyltransferase